MTDRSQTVTDVLCTQCLSYYGEDQGRIVFPCKHLWRMKWLVERPWPRHRRWDEPRTSPFWTEQYALAAIEEEKMARDRERAVAYRARKKAEKKATS
jgi:hypothetical protein